jgi:hypothetical protein
MIKIQIDSRDGVMVCEVLPRFSQNFTYQWVIGSDQVELHDHVEVCGVLPMSGNTQLHFTTLLEREFRVI